MREERGEAGSASKDRIAWEELELDAPVQATSTEGEEFRGDLFCYHADSATVVLRTKLPDSPEQYVVLKTDAIRSLHLQASGREASCSGDARGDADAEALQATSAGSPSQTGSAGSMPSTSGGEQQPTAVGSRDAAVVAAAPAPGSRDAERADAERADAEHADASAGAPAEAGETGSAADPQASSSAKTGKKWEPCD